MRLIDANAFNELLDNAEIEAVKNRKYVFASAINVIRGNLANMPYSDPCQYQWIPVSEQLPEKYNEYLVTYIAPAGTHWTYVIIAHYSDLMGIAKPCFHIGNVGKNDFQNITDGVVAWMPLPEPYKEKME